LKPEAQNRALVRGPGFCAVGAIEATSERTVASLLRGLVDGRLRFLLRLVQRLLRRL
jgi:hypothetical protein